MVSKEPARLRWGYSTGACAAAVAVAAWLRLRDGERPESVRLHFLDGRERRLPLLPPPAPYQACIRKNGGDDPDCTHGATVCARLRAATPDECRPEDHLLRVEDADLILRGGTGIGLCTRAGLDCEPGHWAITSGPRRMLTDNLRRAGLHSGCWLLEISIPEGVELARHTLNPQLGVAGGLSLLGATGLVRPYSHEAYLATIRICVEGHARNGGRCMVFCTGGRTRAGAGKRLPDLPDGAFVCIGDFIAESLELACHNRMREIVVACMAGKLCKYAAGFRNTHAAKSTQDMALLRAEVRRCLPRATALHEALAHSASVREALLSLPDDARPALLRRLAHRALEQFARHCPASPALRLLVFDFDGGFLFEEALPAGSAPSPARTDDPDALPDAASSAEDLPAAEGQAVRRADPPESVDEAYFLRPENQCNGQVDVISCGIGFPDDETTRALLTRADAVYASRALLAACPLPLAETHAIAAHARQDAEDILRRSRGGARMAVLTSGDALYHGFGGTLSALARPGDNIIFHPGITAFQALFHRLGHPWQEARLFCVHAGEDIPARQIAQWPLTVTYAGSRHTADAIARAVLETHPEAAGRAAVMAERLGSPEERLVRAPLRDIAALTCGPTSMLVLLGHQADDPANAALPPLLALGLPDEAYAHEAHLITAPDVRAVILSRLRLPHWGVLWDMGAGSGSVGLEAAALCPGLRVVGVERKAERVALMERNARRLGLDNYSARTGEALALSRLPAGAPDALPDPDRIFLGGGGRELPDLLTACMERLRPGGLLAASSVTLQSLDDLLRWSPERRTGICRLDVAVEAPLARVHRHLSPQRTIHIFTFQKEAQA
ncbi:cobalt-precorrin-5B (C(1))-methyltransferase CbiD [uncultured Desulfovibrio sp.]|uniref:cobalt-precorrin-5B (C(1))-methyltransferase CbiD n=1 Tax=uncultured Desulfovibrio sp. TaxID=167968 RepID=UPI00320A6AC8